MARVTNKFDSVIKEQEDCQGWGGELEMPGHCTMASAGVSCVSLVLLTEGFLFVLGGQDENKQTLSSGEKYDPDANTWTALPPMNEVWCSLSPGCVSFLSGSFIGCGFPCRERRGSLASPYLDPCSPKSSSPPCLLLASSTSSLQRSVPHLPYYLTWSQDAFPPPSLLSAVPYVCTHWLYMFL